MPHKIIIDGEIGWEVTAEGVRTQLSEAKGQDVEIELSSGGGSVFEGITIYNLIKNYEGKTVVNISGLAASMGSYIALAGDEVTVSENSVFMIHNPWGFSGGDHKELAKTVKLLKSLSGLLNKAYAAKTGMSSEEITPLMDDETWYFGSEIVDAGFADSVVEAKVKEDREDAVLSAMLKVEACNAKLRQEEHKEDLSKAAALFKYVEKSEPNGAAHLTPAPKAKTPTPKENMSVDLEAPEVVEAIAKAVAEAKAKVEPKEEPVAKEETKTPSDMAMDILASAHYPDSVKAFAKKVLKGENTAENLEALVAMADLTTEKVKSDEAVAETEEIGATPPQQPKEKSASGVTEAAAHVKDFIKQSGGK